MPLMFTKEPVQKPRRNKFNLSFNNLFTCDAGKVIPVCIQEMLPGDTFKYSSEFLVRMQPTVSPTLSKIKARIETFFVPSRILDEDFERFISGPVEPLGSELPIFLKKHDWRVSLYNALNHSAKPFAEYNQNIPKFTLWDYLGLPVGDNHLMTPPAVGEYYPSYINPSSEQYTNLFNQNCKIFDFPLMAYWRIWFDYYRDENIAYRFYDDREQVASSILETAQDFQDDDFLGWWQKVVSGSYSSITIQRPFIRAWTKNDYFESALLHRQRGVEPALNFTFQNVPIDAQLSAVPGETFIPTKLVQMSDLDGVNPSLATQNYSRYVGVFDKAQSSALNHKGLAQEDVLPVGGDVNDQVAGSQSVFEFDDVRTFHTTAVSGDYRNYQAGLGISDLTGKTSVSGYALTSLLAGGANATDIRNVLAVQSFLEKNMRFGSRYNEQVLAHFGVRTADYRIDRAEYIGSISAPVIVSEIPQTSSTEFDEEDPTKLKSTPQGNLAGRGIAANKGRVSKYTAHEHGYFVSLFSIMPEMNYIGQGYDRKWIKSSRYDWFFPSLAHLSERQVANYELYSDTSDDKDELPFGYQGMYAEYRYNRNITTTDFRDTFEYWHLSRKFESRPEYNQQFVEAQVPVRIFAVQDEPGYLVHLRNTLIAKRPIPVYAKPNDFGF